MTDMTSVIIPKSDQLNSDDLISGPRTIRITEVAIRATPEQPVSIYYEGDGGKPWKPCKSMSRVLVAAWGPDAKAYVGRSVTLYRDPAVKWGGMQVGGIRISHLSHIERDMVMALTETKGKRAPYKVQVLKGAQSEQPREPAAPPADNLTHPTATITARADKVEAALRRAGTLEELTNVWRLAGPLRGELDEREPDRLAELQALYDERDLALDVGAPA